MRRRVSLPILLLVSFALRVGAEPALPARELPRIVSLNPSLTEILLALDVGSALVGVDDWSARAQPAVAELPRVGGLFNPSLEGILALEPDLVVLVPSAQQRNLRERLEALGTEVLVLENIRLGEVLASITTLGARLGREAQARERVHAVRLAFTASERASRGERPRAILVLQRDPLYVVGRGSFLDDMLVAAGATNLGAELDEPYPRASVEWLIAAAPDLIVDVAAQPERASGHWERWPSLPAVTHGRVVTLPADAITLPGPYLDRAVRLLAGAVKGDAVAIDTAP